MESDLLNIGQVVARLGCSTAHFRRKLVGKGFPRPVTIAGANYWYPRDVETYLYLLGRGAFEDLPPEKTPQTVPKATKTEPS